MPEAEISRGAAVVLIAALAAAFVVSVVASAGETRYHDPGELMNAFQCIHRFEGAWDADTGNGYFGGLQMDATFERTYGREFVQAFGHASNWPPAVQMAVAIKGYLDRGFTPWPNTARLCGLLP